MASLTLKDIPAGLHEQLRQPAVRNRRSLSQEALACLEQVTAGVRVGCQAISLASQSGCSTYDCEFVALAHDLAVRLVTNDTAVLRAFPDVAIPLKHFAAAP